MVHEISLPDSQPSLSSANHYPFTAGLREDAISRVPRYHGVVSVPSDQVEHETFNNIETVQTMEVRRDMKSLQKC